MGRFPLHTRIRIPNPQRGILNPRLSRMTLYGDKGGLRAFSLGVGGGGPGGGGGGGGGGLCCWIWTDPTIKH